MVFEKWFLRNGFGVEGKENYRKCYTKEVEVNEHCNPFFSNFVISPHFRKIILISPRSGTHKTQKYFWFQAEIFGGDPSRWEVKWRKNWHFSTFSVPKAPKTQRNDKLSIIISTRSQRLRRREKTGAFFRNFEKFVNENAVKSSLRGFQHFYHKNMIDFEVFCADDAKNVKKCIIYKNAC